MLCNAVWVMGRTKSVWRTNSASIEEFDRVEGSISVTEIDDLPTLEAIGDAYLDLYAFPTESYVIETITDAPAVGVGGLVNVSGTEDLRVVEMAYKLEDGRLVGVPVVSSPLQETIQRKRRQLDTMIKAVGGTFGTSASPIDLGSGIKSGRIESRKLESWTWSDFSDLDNAWDPTVGEYDGGMFGSPYRMEEPARLIEWSVEARAFDDDDEQITVGPTTFELYIDDAPISPPFVITLSATETKKSQYIYGPATVFKGTMIRPVNLLNGGHAQGTVQLLGAEPI